MRVLVLGAGAHARVLVDALRSMGADIVGLLDPAWQSLSREIEGSPVLGGDDHVAQYRPEDVQLVNGVGSTATMIRRRELFERFKAAGYAFATIIHRSAIVAPSARLDEGCQIMAGCVIQSGARIGTNTIVNTGSTVDHDCVIGAHVHLAPGCTLSGGVTIGTSTHVGTGAVVIENITIGAESLVAAGAVVVANVAGGARVQGIPAREVSR